MQKPVEVCAIPILRRCARFSGVAPERLLPGGRAGVVPVSGGGMNSLLGQVERVPVESLGFYPGNPRVGNVPAIADSLRENGQYAPLVVQASTRHVLAGNHTLKAAKSLGWDEIDVVLVDVDDKRARKILLSSNRIPELGDYDEQALAEVLAGLDGDLDGTGWDVYDLDEIADALGRDEPIGDTGGRGEAPEPEVRPSLADRFLIPPFSVLDARQGWWQDRKRAWISLGIRSEIGRVADANYAHDSPVKIKPGLVTGSTGKAAAQVYGSRHVSDPGYYAKKRKGTLDADAPDTGYTSGTSVFDPVLCEVAYRWFSPPGGHVVDPFAGGSVRGVVAAALGRTYAGNDLSAGQVTANEEQADDMAARGILDRDAVSWSIGDSADWATRLEPDSADLIFSCPPYLWLERYSDDPADLSTMTEDAFADAYTRILSGAASALRDNRFAVLVVGDARDKRGRLADLHGLTVECAARAGLALHTTAVLVTQCGSLPVRAARQFEASRILGGTHQDVLVFVKGTRSAAAKACGDVEVNVPDAVAEAWEETG